MADYPLLTIWQIEAPIEEVWEAISHAERWPSWWKGVEKVEQLEPGDEHGIGRVHPLYLEKQAPLSNSYLNRARSKSRNLTPLKLKPSVN